MALDLFLEKGQPCNFLKLSNWCIISGLRGSINKNSNCLLVVEIHLGWNYLEGRMLAIIDYEESPQTLYIIAISLSYCASVSSFLDFPTPFPIKTICTLPFLIKKDLHTSISYQKWFAHSHHIEGGSVLWTILIIFNTILFYAIYSAQRDKEEGKGAGSFWCLWFKGMSFLSSMKEMKL